MEIVFKYAWIFLIAITTINGIILKVRSNNYISEKPELKEGYNKYFFGIIFYGNFPWIIMAIGNLSGMSDSVFDYFNPKSMNPIVLIFHASIIFLWVLGIIWIYFRKGAEFIEQHPGLFFSANENIAARHVKLFYPILLLGGITGMIMMWVMDFSIPLF